MTDSILADPRVVPPLQTGLRTHHERLPLTHLKQLEAESIHIIREVAAEFENPVMLYSIGKDSSVLVRLAHQGVPPGAAAVPAAARRHHLEVPRDDRVPRPLLPRATASTCSCTRTRTACAQGINPFDHGSKKYTRRHEDAGAAAGAATRAASTRRSAARAATRRSRAPRSASTRSATASTSGIPKNQRPELWNLYNGKVNKGESIRVFPLSNWTELDVWQYIYLENIPIVPLYFAAERPVVERDGTLIMVDDERMRLEPGEKPRDAARPLPHARLLSADAARSSRRATTLPEIIREMLLARHSERQGRLIDHDEDGSMEQKKREGYF